MINARTEVIAKARLVKNRQVELDEELDDGCTGAVILPERSATGAVIHGQTGTGRPNAPKPRSCCVCAARTDRTS